MSIPRTLVDFDLTGYNLMHSITRAKFTIIPTDENVQLPHWSCKDQVSLSTFPKYHSFSLSVSLTISAEASITLVCSETTSHMFIAKYWWTKYKLLKLLYCVISPNQWFLNFLPNQAWAAWAAELAAQAWFGRRFNIHWFQTRVFGTCWNQDDEL